MQIIGSGTKFAYLQSTMFLQMNKLLISSLCLRPAHLAAADGHHYLVIMLSVCKQQVLDSSATAFASGDTTTCNSLQQALAGAHLPTMIAVLASVLTCSASRWASPVHHSTFKPKSDTVIGANTVVPSSQNCSASGRGHVCQQSSLHAVQ